MATIYNSDLSKELIEGAKIQTSFDSIPNQLAEKVVPVMEVNPKLLRRIDFIKSATKSVTGASTFTSLTDSDVMITNLNVGMIKDVVCDAATGSIEVTIITDGVSKAIASIPIITLTAQNQIMCINFNPPIKMDRNTTFSLSGTYAAGVMVRNYTLSGYQIINPRA